MLDYLNAHKSYAQGVSGLDYLNAPNSLTGTLQLFLLPCKVNELSPRTIEDYREKIGRFVDFCAQLGAVAPNSVNANLFRLFLLSLQKTCNRYTIRDYHGCISRLFNWMVEEGMLGKSPIAVVRKPKVPETIIQPLKLEHIRRLLLLWDDDSFLSLRNQAIILMFLDTGLRLSELANIQLGEIDFDRGMIKVMGKGSKERFVAVGKKAQKAILRYLLKRSDQHSCLWVTEEKTPLRALGIQTMIKRARRRAGITGVRCSAHTFRHTFATEALRRSTYVGTRLFRIDYTA